MIALHANECCFQRTPTTPAACENPPYLLMVMHITSLSMSPHTGLHSTEHAHVHNHGTMLANSWHIEMSGGMPHHHVY